MYKISIHVNTATHQNATRVGTTRRSVAACARQTSRPHHHHCHYLIDAMSARRTHRRSTASRQCVKAVNVGPRARACRSPPSFDVPTVSKMSAMPATPCHRPAAGGMALAGAVQKMQNHFQGSTNQSSLRLADLPPATMYKRKHKRKTSLYQQSTTRPSNSTNIDHRQVCQVNRCCMRRLPI